MAGEDDNFALPFDPIPYVNPDFANASYWPGLGRLKQFDEPRDQVLFASLILPSLHFCSGEAEFHFRKGVSSYQNDVVGFGVAPKPAYATGLLWQIAPDAPERLLTIDISPEVLLDAQRAQVGKKTTSLDFYIGHGTTVDYIKLTLVY
jgi:hypothetical protein